MRVAGEGGEGMRVFSGSSKYSRQLLSQSTHSEPVMLLVNNNKQIIQGKHKIHARQPLQDNVGILL